MKNHNYELRYSPNWPTISRKCRKSLKGKCTLCQNNSTQTHHAFYGLLGIPIAGWAEVPGWSIFPLCDDCHTVAHTPANYHKDRQNPVTGNRNRFWFWLLLFISYWLKR